MHRVCFLLFILFFQPTNIASLSLFLFLFSFSVRRVPYYSLTFFLSIFIATLPLSTPLTVVHSQAS
jgi:hypothetical protein